VSPAPPQQKAARQLDLRRHEPVPPASRRRRPRTRRASGGVELLDPLKDGRWQAFIARVPGAGVHHHRAWLDLLRSAYGYPLTACCVVDGAGSIRAGAPLALVPDGPRRRRLACVPFAVRCGPLPLPDEDPAPAHELVVAIDELRRSLGVPAELRGPIAPHPSAHVAANHRTHQIPLRPGARILPAADDAASAGLVVERRTDARALGDFYRVHQAACRRRGVPTHPRRFILGFAHLFDHGLGFVLLARDRGRPVAGAVLTSFNRILTFQYGACAEGERSGPARDLVVLAAIRWGCEAGMHTLDLGREDADDGLDFKLSLGAEERLVAYRQLRDDPPPRRCRDRGAWTAPLIRHTPAMVSRLLGEALYPRTA
jgi:hypothetical protein